MDELIQLKTWIPLLIPLIVLQLGLMIGALVDLGKRSSVRFNNKAIWAIIIVCINIIGPIIYFVFRGEDE